MADQDTERQRKRVTILSRSSFWWRVIKESLKHSRDPFEHVTTYLGIFVGLAVICFTLKLFDQEWVDKLIYYTLAIASTVWAWAFIWNLIKMPHKIYKTEIAALLAGADAVTDRKTGFRNFSRFFLISLIVGSFICVFVVKNKQISELKNQLATTKQPEPPKPYVVKEIIKTNIQSLAMNQPPATNSVAADTNSEPKKFTEVFKPHGDSPTNYLDTLAETVQKRTEEKEAAEKLATEKTESDELFAINAGWTNLLPHFQHVLTSLHGAVYNIASSRRTNISETYYNPTHFPAEIKKNGEQIQVADLGIQNNTNWNFHISIRPAANSVMRCDFNLTMSCAGGAVTLQIIGNPKSMRYRRTFGFESEKYKKLATEMSEASFQSITNMDDSTDTAIDVLVSANNQFLTETRTNKSDTNIVDKTH